MNEIVNRLHENKQIELAKSILESNGYKVTKKSKRLKEASEPSALRKMLDIDTGVNNYSDYPEMFDRYGVGTLEEITGYLGCRVDNLVEIFAAYGSEMRDAYGNEADKYKELLSYVHKNSSIEGSINIEAKQSEPSHKLVKCVVDGVRFIKHTDSDSFNTFILSDTTR